MSLLFFSSTTRAAVVNEKGFFCLSAVNSGVWHVYGPRSVLQMQCTALLLCARKTQASQAPRWRYYKLRFGNLFKIEQLAKCWFSRNGFSWSSKKNSLEVRKNFSQKGLSWNRFSRYELSWNRFSQTDSLKRILSKRILSKQILLKRFFSKGIFPKGNLSEDILSE